MTSTTSQVSVECPVGMAVMRHPVRYTNSDGNPTCTHILERGQALQDWVTRIRQAVRYGRDGEAQTNEACPFCRRNFQAIRYVGGGEEDNLLQRIQDAVARGEEQVDPTQFENEYGNEIERVMNEQGGILRRAEVVRIMDLPPEEPPAPSPAPERELEIETNYSSGYCGSEGFCGGLLRVCALFTAVGAAVWCGLKLILSIFRCCRGGSTVTRP